MKALRLLYLEDNPDHVELVSAAVQPQFPGSSVECATVIQNALECLQCRRYDAILLSATVNNESTLPHLEKVLPLAHAAPVIVISGDGDEKLAANAIKHGASDYLVKSRESLEVLPYLIQRLLKKRRHPVSETAPATPATQFSEGVHHLMTEIDHVAQRIHGLQETSHTTSAISSLREELRLLRQFAEELKIALGHNIARGLISNISRKS